MKKLFGRIIALGLAGVMVAGSLGTDVKASNLCSDLPVAGIARSLGEGKSVTVVKADKIKSTTTSSSVLAAAGESTERTSAYDFSPKASTIKETAATSDPSLITVGAASVTVNETISENLVLTESANLETPTDSAVEEAVIKLEEESAGGEDNQTSESSAVEPRDEMFADGEVELVNAVSQEKSLKEDEEDFTNLVIAQVNDYVNVRSEASEESEVVGKLYNKSVGELIETEGEWYKIKSGNCVGYVKGEFVVTGDDAQSLAKEVGTRMAVVTTTTLYVREAPSTNADVIGMVPIDDELTVSEELDGWARVSVEEGDGYVSTEFVKLYTDFVHAESKEEEEARLAKEKAAREAAQKAAKKAEEQLKAKNKKNNGGASSSGGGASYAVAGSGTGSSVANFALQFVGNPYVYGGTSLTNGADCSGFVMSVYRNFGVSLPHSSGGDRGVGYDVGGLANAQAGDIVCYSGHVAIYIGNGQIVHASTASTGIKVSNANYRNVLAVRRIF